ncbi:MAG: FG-GAP-like repeat-containing protein, partial [Saprospiraceae bacterium]
SFIRKVDLYFTDISMQLPVNFKHKENYFIDFKREPLLIRKLSEEGPAVAVGDVNGDQLDDIYIGGASTFAGQLYIQGVNGQYQLSKNNFDEDKNSEDVAACFMDMNGDHLLDLYVVSGGNEFEAGSKEYQDRIYINQGNSVFAKAANLVPTETNSGSCVAYSDIDGDRDSDLFIGSRSIPGKYPQKPEHMFLINENGKYTNKINEIGKEINELGMITDAVFADLDNDRINELIVCGEFMPMSVFKLVNGLFQNVTNKFGLDKSLGLWQSIQVFNLNNDSFPDIVGGNLGLNSNLHASESKPLELYYSDFDKNGSIDPVICQYNGDKSYPIQYRDRLLDQMVFLKKKFNRYEQYANVGINEIFSVEQMKNSSKLLATSLSSQIFMNQGGKKFTNQQLPIECQFSVIQGSQTCDFNHDGITDLITVGNFFGTDAQFGCYDASHSCLLKGNNTGSFEYIPIQNGGLNINGDVRGILPLRTKGGTMYLVSRNNDHFSLLKLSK